MGRKVATLPCDAHDSRVPKDEVSPFRHDRGHVDDRDLNLSPTEDPRLDKQCSRLSGEETEPNFDYSPYSPVAEVDGEPASGPERSENVLPFKLETLGATVL
jgi:hypothetical protein